MSDMRAKVKVQSVITSEFSEQLLFSAVCKNEGYGSDGLDENNTYSKYTPAATFAMSVTNPALIGKFKQGETYYVDFTKAD